MAWYNQIPVIGGFFDNPEEEAVQKELANMSQAYQQSRPQVHAAQAGALGSQLSMFGPVQEALSQAYPGISPFDTQGAANTFHRVTNGMGPAYAASPERVKR